MANKIILLFYTRFTQFPSTCYKNVIFHEISFSWFIQCTTIKIHDISSFWKLFEIYEIFSFTKYSREFPLISRIRSALQIRGIGGEVKKNKLYHYHVKWWLVILMS